MILYELIFLIFLILGCCGFFGVSISNAQHESTANFNKFPRWFQETYDDGFFLCGWVGQRTYAVFAFLDNSTASGCQLSRMSTFYWNVKFTGKENNQKCILSYKYGNKVKKAVLDEAHLPQPSCSDPTESYYYVYPESHAPGERVVYCKNFTMYMEWYEFQHNSTGCYNVYFRPTLRPCSGVELGSRKLLASCSVDISKSRINKGSEVTVTTHTDGTIHLKSNRFIKSEICNQECSIEIGEVSELTVTCPDGTQHHFSLDEDLRSRCWGVDTPYLRWVAITVCKTTYHPWLIILLFLWMLVSHVVFSILCSQFSSLVRWVHLKVEKKIKELDPELGLCRHCMMPMKNEDEVKEHIRCKEGICVYCTNIVALSVLPTHAKKCSSNKELLENMSIDMKTTVKALRFSKILMRWSLSSVISNTVRWIGSIIIICLIFIPPINSRVVINSHQDESVETVPALDSFFDREYDVSQLANGVAYGSFTPFRPGYFEQLNNELELCGTGCFNEDHICNCPDMDFAGEMTSEEMIHIQDDHDHMVVKRDAEQHNIMKHKSKSRKSKVHPEFDQNKPSNMNKLNFYELKQDGSVDEKDGRNPKSTNFAEFHQAASVLTNWGTLDLNKEFEPADSARNIDLTWESYKKDKENFYIKGSTTAVLELVKGNGVTYIISHPKSNEKVKVSSYIYDFSQKYTTKLKYITADRKLTTWFRGACTGNCPESCSCKTATCFNKKWDYDRNLGCNPTWCWATNSGCSCCAADVDVRSSNWIMAVYEVRYESTEVLVCQTAGFDKFNCKIVSDNTAIQLDELKFTYAKVQSVDYKLPEEIAVYWDVSGKSKMKIAFPDGVLLSPEVCDSNCNHGEPGDYKASHLSALFRDANQNSYSESMSWIGVDVEHTCHFASWPDCDFYFLKKDITDSFNFIIENTEKLTDRFIPQRILVHNNSQLDIRVRPKSNAGNIEMTMQVKNFILKRENIVPSVNHFRLLNCVGCYGCSSGIVCTFSIRLKAPSAYNIHLKTDMSYLSISDMSFRLTSENRKTVFNIRCFSILNISSITMYVEEVPTQISTIKVSLAEPSGILVETNHHIGVVNEDKSKCKGFGGAVVCMISNVGRFGSNLGSSLFSFFSDWYSAGKAILLMILLSLAICITYKASMLIFKVLRTRTPLAKIDPTSFLKSGSKKGK